MKTYSIKPSEIKREWFVIDASEAPLGRLATTVSSLLLGKGKPTITPHMDGGDYVVIINSSKLVVTGKKAKRQEISPPQRFPGRTLYSQP
jgi:large subunit ribosomal protein L13